MRTLLIAAALAALTHAARAQDTALAGLLPAPAAAPAGKTASAAPATEAVRFGYLSYTDALRAMPGYAAAQETVRKLRAAYQEELRRSEAQFSQQFAEYVEGQSAFPENILLKRQKELQQLMEEGLKFRDEALRLLAEAEERAMVPLHERLEEAVRAVGTERGFAFVLNTDNRAFPFVSGTVGSDITADVLARLK